MKILPLVIHGGMIIPRHTSLFSTSLAVDSITVTDGGSVVIATTAAHGVPVGSSIAVSITDADTPNPITAADVDDAGNVVITTQYPHSLTTTPDVNLLDQYSQLAKLAGFTSGLINGNRQIVDVPDRYRFVAKPGGAVSDPVTLNGAEVLFERLEQELVGWHSVVATGTHELSFATPAGVNRDYVAFGPIVVTDIRIWGALDGETALAQYTAADADVTLDKPVMFVTPQPVRRRGQGVNYLTSGSDNRMMVEDGFVVLVLIPSHETSAHVAASDLAHGTIFSAVMRTFHGLKLSRSEFMSAGDFRATFEEHRGGRVTNKAIYAHEYTFAMPAEITSCDGVSPFEWSQIDDAALADGDIPSSIYPSDPVPWRDLDISGIIHHGHPSPLIGSATINEEA